METPIGNRSNNFVALFQLEGVGTRSSAPGFISTPVATKKEVAGGCDAAENCSNGSDRPGGAGWLPRSFAWALVGHGRWHRSRQRR